MNYPHLPGCPNGPEDETAFACDGCDEDVFAGEKYLSFDNGLRFCEDCVRRFSVMDWMENLGIDWEEAEPDG